MMYRYYCKCCKKGVNDRHNYYDEYCKHSSTGKHQFGESTDFSNDLKWSESFVGRHWKLVLVAVGILIILHYTGLI